VRLFVRFNSIAFPHGPTRGPDPTIETGRDTLGSRGCCPSGPTLGWIHRKTF
jgi:hypothetical protein